MCDQDNFRLCRQKSRQAAEGLLFFIQLIWNKSAVLIRVLPTFSWVEAQTAAMEEACGFEVFDVYEAASSSLDGHYYAVQAFGDPVGDWM